MMKPIFDIKYCTTKDAQLFTDVIKLRYEAYRADNRLTWQRSWVDMQDQHDERSVIISASVDNAVCGSVRIKANHDCDVLSYPKPNISLNQYVESSRLCVAPHCRGKGLWYVLAAHMIIMSHKTGREFIVGGAIDELVPTWTKVGFKKTGYRYFSDDINGADHELLMLNIAQVLAGRCHDVFYHVLRQELLAAVCENEEVISLLLR